MSNKRRIKIDASALVKAACRLRLKYIVLDGYADKHNYNDTFYGTCFHKFVALMYETNGNFAEAINHITEKFVKTPKVIRDGKGHLNEHHLVKTCIDYWQYFQSKDNFEVLVHDGKPMVEVDFLLPIYENENLIIEATGTIDKLGQFKGGCYAIGDYKTHSLWSVNKNGDPTVAIKKFFKQFELSTQLRFYTRAIKQLGSQNPDSVFGTFAKNPFGAFIDGLFLSSSSPTKFARSDVMFFSDREMEWYEQTLTVIIARLIELYKEPEYNRPDGIVVGLCNEGKFPCQFQNVCLQKDDAIKQLILKNDFVKKEYNPLTFSK